MGKYIDNVQMCGCRDVRILLTNEMWMCKIFNLMIWQFDDLKMLIFLTGESPLYVNFQIFKSTHFQITRSSSPSSYHYNATCATWH